MRPVIRTTRDELRAVTEKARDLMAEAEREDRLLRDGERKEIGDALAQAEKLQSRIRQADADRDLTDRLESMLGGARRVTGGGSLGEQFVKTSEYLELRGRLPTSMPFRVGPIELQAAAITSPSTGWLPGTLAPPVPDPIAPPFGSTRVAQLFVPGEVGPDAGAVVFIPDPGHTNVAAPVAEGNPKPEVALTAVPTTLPLCTIAHWAPVSNQTLEDVASIRSWIDGVLVADLVDKEEEMLLTGDGVPPNPLGLLATSGLTAARPKADGESIADAILQAALGVQAAARMAVDGVVLGPLTFGALVSEKAETSGNYLSGAPNTMAPSLNIWGLRPTRGSRPCVRPTRGCFVEVTAELSLGRVFSGLLVPKQLVAPNGVRTRVSVTTTFSPYVSGASSPPVADTFDATETPKLKFLGTSWSLVSVPIGRAYRPMISSALRSGALEIFMRPSSGEFISRTRKIAAAIEQALTMSARNTIQLRGAKTPKLKKSSASQNTSTLSRIGGSPRCASSISSQREREMVFMIWCACASSARCSSVVGLSARKVTRMAAIPPPCSIAARVDPGDRSSGQMRCSVISTV
jgi:HK97 family phage major capsid protein